MPRYLRPLAPPPTILAQQEPGRQQAEAVAWFVFINLSWKRNVLQQVCVPHPTHRKQRLLPGPGRRLANERTILTNDGQCLYTYDK